MANNKRYLITTADERTWKFDRPVIFLGEWCRIYNRRHIWQNMDAIVAAPYGLGLAKKDADHAEARVLEDKLFPAMCEALNQYHDVQHGERFWRIVLGHWLRRYVDVILNRVKTLEQCLQAHQVSGMTVFENHNHALSPQDSYAAIWYFGDDRWNNILSMHIIQLLGAASFPIEVIPDDQAEGSRSSELPSNIPQTKKCLNWTYYQIRKLLLLMARHSDSIITNTYLPRNYEVKLQIALGQIPQAWVIPELKLSARPDPWLRQNEALKIIDKSGDKLYGILSGMVFKILPVCYLEGLPELNDLIKEMSWPKEPKFIFTSNNFDTSEVFKMWSAMKVETGTKYIIGQHGNNYGTHRYMNPTIEEITADKFLTWGWTDCLPQHTPLFILKKAGGKTADYNPKGGLLLLEMHSSQRMALWDETCEFGEYFQAQKCFVNKLSNEPRNNLTIRFHPGYRCLKWYEELRWQAFDINLRIDLSGVSIWKLIGQSRLVVYSYDSTGMLETLSHNIPTIAFWQNGFDHLRESAKPHYKVLVDAGILHLTAESTALKVNEIWNNIGSWWNQSTVQDARRSFCDAYCKVSPKPICELKKSLVS